MSRPKYLKAVFIIINCIVLNFSVFSSLHAETSIETDPGTTAQSIVVTLFTSSECPFCDNVKELVEDLKTQLPIKTELFDINKPNDFDLYCKIEATHKKAKFAVPLVIVGETVLIGQSEIFAKLESTIKSLEASGQTNPLTDKTGDIENSKTSHKKNHHKIAAGSKKEHMVEQATQHEIESGKIKIINDDHD